VNACPRRRGVDGGHAMVAVIVLATLLIGAVYYVKAIDSLGDRADANSKLSYSDRRVAGGNSIVIDQEAASEADVLIPRRQPYRVRVGPRLRGATALTSSYVEPWYQYFLLPRRQSRDARWIICYGCDTSELGNYLVRWRDANRISIGRRG
jgi:hypothetical protein